MTLGERWSPGHNERGTEELPPSSIPVHDRRATCCTYDVQDKKTGVHIEYFSENPPGKIESVAVSNEGGECQTLLALKTP